jgi:hypothetical protein
LCCRTHVVEHSVVEHGADALRTYVVPFKDLNEEEALIKIQMSAKKGQGEFWILRDPSEIRAEPCHVFMLAWARVAR